MIDVIVAGAGPAGLAVAIQAAMEGLDVRVIDPRDTPIDKACGEGLMPEALTRLAHWGIDPEGRDFTGIRYIAPGRSAVAHFAQGHGRGVRRTLLQAQMQSKAQDLGVRFAQGRVHSVDQYPDHVSVGGLDARYLIGADGLRSHVRTSLGITTKVGQWHRFGIRQHFAVRPWTNVVEVYWLPESELYVTPIDEHTVGVAVLGSAPLELNQAIARVPSLAARLRHAAPVSSPRGAGPMRIAVSHKSRGRTALVGDASGYVDALTGEGIRIAFAQAHAAVSSILDNDLEGYDAQWQRITRSYRMLTSSILFAARTRHLRNAIVPAAQVMPRAFAHIVNLL